MYATALQNNLPSDSNHSQVLRRYNTKARPKIGAQIRFGARGELGGFCRGYAG